MSKQGRNPDAWRPTSDRFCDASLNNAGLSDGPDHDCKVDDGTLCPKCCDHEEHDHGICMDCEKDITDELASDAYDHAKGLRQDRDVP